MESIKANRPYRIELTKTLERSRTGHPLHACFLSREEGLQQISNCFLNLREEHAWIFLPEHQLWIDDTTEIAEGSVKGDFLVRTHLINRFPEVHLFHTHPTPLYLDDMRENGLDGKYLRIAAIPTCQDIFALAYVMECCSGIDRVIGHVVSQFGVTSYERTDNVIPEGWTPNEFHWDDLVAEVQKSEDTLASVVKGIDAYMDSFRVGDDIRWPRVPLWKFQFSSVR